VSRVVDAVGGSDTAEELPMVVEVVVEEAGEAGGDLLDLAQIAHLLLCPTDKKSNITPLSISPRISSTK
jgi:hypothetical protein